MSEAAFEDQVAAALARSAVLRQKADPASDAVARALLTEGLEELSFAFEELQIAQDELRVQNEALAAADAAADLERERYQDLFDLAPSAYLVTDADGAIRQANQAAGDLLNVAPKYLVGKPLSVFVASADRNAFLAQLSGLWAGQAARTRVVRVQPRPDGSNERVAELTVAPDQDPGTGRTQLRWQLRDVTVEHRSGAELRKLNAELEARVHSRTAALEELLRGKEVAEKRLAEADRRKDEFLFTLSHELRNPLGAIQTAVGVLQMPGAAGEIAERALGAIDRQLRRMTRMVTDLLDVSRIAQGKLSVRLETIDLAEAARAAVEATAGQAAELKIKTQVTAESVWVRADPGRLEQVLTNLLTNAVKYTEAGGAVTVTVGPEDRRAVARVRDTGVGIGPDLLPQVFELFVQADAGRSQGGLGIGLHLVKRLVEFHGGTVEAHSEGPGTGSMFTVRLPAVSPPR
ncbi:MAG TPA: ATP-binding protein [Gemmataceae bacterium]|nr:ATP-binding protein [Gemmataceae bacterium]